MVCCEAGDVLCEQPGALVVYKRYIDDLLIVWKGDL